MPDSPGIEYLIRPPICGQCLVKVGVPSSSRATVDGFQSLPYDSQFGMIKLVPVGSVTGLPIVH